MKNGITEVYCGNGRGRTTLAIGQGLRASTEGKSVIIIQFLKGRERQALDFLEEMDNLDIKIFRFEKRDSCYEDLNEQERQEECTNIRNGLNFARKVVATGECDFLILDEMLGLIDYGIATEDEIEKILQAKDDDMHIILTGRRIPDALRHAVDSVTEVETTDYTDN